MARFVAVFGLALAGMAVFPSVRQWAAAQTAPTDPASGAVAIEPTAPDDGAAAPASGLRNLACARRRGFPVADALRLGPDALPVLWALLDDPATERCWPGAVLAAGIVAGPGVYPRLRRFIEETAVRPAGDDAFVAMRLAFEGLGSLVWRAPDSDAGREALAYLIESTGTEAWEERNLDWRLADEERRYVTKVLVATAVVGLAFTAHDGARLHLEQMLTREPEAVECLGPDSYALVEESIDALERRQAEGIEAEPGAGCLR